MTYSILKKCDVFPAKKKKENANYSKCVSSFWLIHRSYSSNLCYWIVSWRPLYTRALIFLLRSRGHITQFWDVTQQSRRQELKNFKSEGCKKDCLKTRQVWIENLRQCQSFCSKTLLLLLQICFRLGLRCYQWHTTHLQWEVFDNIMV